MPDSGFTLKAGDLKKIRTTHIDEGFDFSVAFCGDCGSPVYGQPHPQSAEAPELGIKVIQIGLLDDIGPLEAKPALEINVKHRLGWCSQIDSAEQRQTYV